MIDVVHIIRASVVAEISIKRSREPVLNIIDMPSKAVAHISHPENAHLEPPLDMVPWDLGKTLYVPPRLIVGRLDVLVRATRQLSQELRETCFASTHGGRKCEMQRHVDAGLRKMAPSAWDINMHELMMERQERGDTCPVHYAPDADVRGALVIATVSLIDSVAPSRAVYTSLPPAQALRRLDDKMRAGSRVDDPESVSMVCDQSPPADGVLADITRARERLPKKGRRSQTSRSWCPYRQAYSRWWVLGSGR